MTRIDQWFYPSGRSGATVTQCVYQQRPAPSSQKPPSVSRVKSPYSEKQRAEAWELCATTVKNHSEEMLKRWEDEINMLLTFVGIHSGFALIVVADGSSLRPVFSQRR